MCANGDDGGESRSVEGDAARNIPTVRETESSGRHDGRPAHGPGGRDSSPPQLGSRILVTWIYLTAVGITGGFLGAAVGGPPGFVIYLATSLLTVAIILHNVNELVKAWLEVT